MRLKDEKLHFSPSDLTAFINCKHLTFLNIEAVYGRRKRPVYHNRVTAMLQQKGELFEENYLDELNEKEDQKVVVIDKEDKNAAQKTIEAIQQGEDVIYQARLEQDGWSGWSDFLIKVNRTSKLGNWSYEVMDTKLATETKASTILQIGLYSEMLSQIQGTMPEFMWVKTPDEELAYRVDDYIAYLRFIKTKFLEFIANPGETYPEPVGHCDICNWWEECNRTRRADDHLGFIAGVGTTQTKELRMQNIHTLEAVARLINPVPFTPSRGSIETYNKIQHQARLQHQSRTEKRPVHEMLPLIPEQGLHKLPEPSQWDVYLDLEGDPMVDPSGREYIFGWIYQNEYHILWAETAEAEKISFEAFMDFAFKLKQEHPEMHIYHYGPYEVSAFKRLMGNYASRENEMDHLLRSGSFIDLLSVVRQSLRAGVERYSLKDLEKYHEYFREMDLRKLSEHKSNYEFLLETNRVADALPEDKAAVQLYNQDDCRSTKNLHTWLEKLRKEMVDSGADIPRPIIQPGDAGENITAHQERIQPIFNALMEGVPVDVNDRNAEQQARFILANMLDWYRREEKSYWWEYFRLIELPDDELLDERNALSGLRTTGEREEVKKSVIDTYSFPAQDCDLKQDNKVKDKEGRTIAEIIELDHNNLIIRLKKGPTKKDLHPTSIFSLEKYPSNHKVEAIISLGEWVQHNGVLSNSGIYRAVRDLLLRNNPAVTGSVQNNSDSIAYATEWALKLNSSVLPIQGPPGSGKSFTASRMILELVSKKKKIGITALSHKVITELLKKIYADSKKLKRKVSIIQKYSGEETVQWDVSNDSNDVASIMADYDIIAGTSFMWCLPAFNQSVDYLFVDEAGQLSLIDTLAIANCATNLVLLGDPQQLKQPQKGVHPDGTDVSALEHVLHGNKTLSDEQGIFLPVTYRMHPSICSFDSELFYENKLSAVPGLENQKIEGKARISGSGLFYLPVIHEGNRNCSVEEAEEVAKLVKELCNGKNYWVNEKNIKEKLTRDHIKIITPYNAQVSELSKRIPGVAIGTVDKFQGQEAPVIIFSMATSTPQDAPRGMDFLYSPNRFNVAVSRARAAFILVANPALFEAECKTPGQIKLVNAFCRYVEVATDIN